MQTKKTTIVSVGLFITFGLIAAMVSIFFIGERSALFEDQYILKARFSEVSGLRSGSVVQLAGLRVGFVEEVQFPQNDGEAGLNVLLSIDQKYQNRIRENSVAMIQTQGLLGDKYVYITPGGGDFSPLQDGDLLQTEEKSEWTSLAEEGSLTLQSIRKAADGLKQALDILADDPANKDRVTRILANLEGGSRSLKAILAAIERGDGTIGALIKDPALYNDMRTLMGRANRSKLLKKLIRATIEEQEKGGRPVE